MIKSLQIKQTDETPAVYFSANGALSIEGSSMPEIPGDFYAALEVWLDKYIEQPADKTCLKVNLNYFNSTSAKRIFQLFLKLEKLKEAGKDIKIDWYYQEDDQLMKTKGEEIQGLLKLPFEMKTV